MHRTRFWFYSETKIKMLNKISMNISLHFNINYYILMLVILNLTRTFFVNKQKL